MAIPCPGCGREYDVTLFQFGRTISCTCGRRIGLEKRVPRDPGRRFLADAMLARLAADLRALGYDTAHDPGIEDGVAVRRAVREQRVLLTRDRRLAEEWRVEGIVVVERDDPDGQLTEVAARFGIRLGDQALFTRCLRCNAMLEPLDREDAAARVPPRVLATNRTFSRCPSCDRAYWQGSHTERMRRRLRALVG